MYTITRDMKSKNKSNLRSFHVRRIYNVLYNKNEFIADFSE